MGLDEMLDILDDAKCDLCKYSDGCPRGAVCYGGTLIEPSCFSIENDELFNINEVRQKLMEEELIMPNVIGVWFNPKKGTTVVKWEDKSITKVSIQCDEIFDKEKGIALCFMKKFCGNTGKYNEIFKQYIHDIHIHDIWEF